MMDKSKVQQDKEFNCAGNGWSAKALLMVVTLNKDLKEVRELAEKKLEEKYLRKRENVCMLKRII